MKHFNFTRLSNSYQGPDQNRSCPGREVERGLEYNQGHYQTSRLSDLRGQIQQTGSIAELRTTRWLGRK